jgi:hypothetical protein
LRLGNCMVWLLVWVHADGSLGLRLEKLPDRRSAPTRPAQKTRLIVG